jgi:parallel beta-helix repeat protein
LEKKHVLSLFTVILFTSLFSVAFKIRKVQATISIGSNYTFTHDIYDQIVVTGDNIVIDGAGYSLIGDNSTGTTGVELSGRSNVTIKNLRISLFWDGIVLWNSESNLIHGNNMSANRNFGIALWNFSNHNTISENNVTANGQDGIGLDLSSYNLIHNNIVAAHYQDGIILDAYSDNNTISWNQVVNNGFGIELYDSSNNTIIQNNLTRNTNYGILLYYSSYNIVSENNVTTSDVEGVFLSYSHFNFINGNYLENNGNGLTVGYGSTNNSIYQNEIINNEYGIQVISSSNNTFCQNNLINNTNQIVSSDSVNRWDCGYPSGGNYWSDYEERYPDATEIDDSGIWDTPYTIDENNQDRYPIIPEFPSILILPLFMIITMLTVTVNKRKQKVR